MTGNCFPVTIGMTRETMVKLLREKLSVWTLAELFTYTILSVIGYELKQAGNDLDVQLTNWLISGTPIILFLITAIGKLLELTNASLWELIYQGFARYMPVHAELGKFYLWEQVALYDRGKRKFVYTINVKKIGNQKQMLLTKGILKASSIVTGKHFVTGKQFPSHDIVTGKHFVTGKPVSQSRSFPVTNCFPVTIKIQKTKNKKKQKQKTLPNF